MNRKRHSSPDFHRIAEWTAIRAVQSGLVNMIPILTIGAFALIAQTFPVEAYQNWIAAAADGFFLKLFELVYSATFGVLSVHMTYSISRAYMRLKKDRDISYGGAVFSSLLSFFLLAGAYLPGFGTDSMGPKSMFLAILTALGASSLYVSLSRLLRRRRQRSLFSTGANPDFNQMLTTFLPIALVALVFALFNALIMRVFRVDSFRTLLIDFFTRLFVRIAPGFLQGFFFVFLSSLLWFFGIHGSDTLEAVMEVRFTPGLAANQAAAAAGQLPHTILTKEFFDCFVLMGGCGSTICLLLAILLFSRNRARRGLGLAATLPMLFNINEMMVFGLPIILNPTMLIPFLTVPLVCYTIAYLALSTGAVPLITGAVNWTTPVLLGGFRATGSLTGSLLQLFNMGVGVLIYLPFVRRLDRKSEEQVRQTYEDFIAFFQENEHNMSTMRLTELNNVYGSMAKELCAELKDQIEQQAVLAYQPQIHYDGRCIGVEALLRWRHPVHGVLYPPLVIKLAEEGGFLPALEEAVLARALADRPKVLRLYGPKTQISVNVTATTVVTPRYQQFCRQLNEKEPFRDRRICIEVTEYAALLFDDETRAALQNLRDMGLMLAIDDFSMGQTSLRYLEDGIFDIIKLDGSLVKGMLGNQNCREIIASITQLAASLDMLVQAEYVGTEEQREALHRIGCDCYQGFLYSPAVCLEEEPALAAS